jgi:hypothetical protein
MKIVVNFMFNKIADEAPIDDGMDLFAFPQLLLLVLFLVSPLV